MTLLAILTAWVVLTTVMCVALAFIAARPTPEINSADTVSAPQRALRLHHAPLGILEPTCHSARGRNGFRQRNSCKLAFKQFLAENTVA